MKNKKLARTLTDEVPHLVKSLSLRVPVLEQHSTPPSPHERKERKVAREQRKNKARKEKRRLLKLANAACTVEKPPQPPAPTYTKDLRISNFRELIIADTTCKQVKLLEDQKIRSRFNQKNYRERVKQRAAITELRSQHRSEAGQRIAFLTKQLKGPQLDRIKRATNKGDPSQANDIVSRSGINETVQRRSMETLQPGAWLSDEVKAIRESLPTAKISNPSSVFYNPIPCR